MASPLSSEQISTALERVITAQNYLDAAKRALLRHVDETGDQRVKALVVELQAINTGHAGQVDKWSLSKTRRHLTNLLSVQEQKERESGQGGLPIFEGRTAKDVMIQGRMEFLMAHIQVDNVRSIMSDTFVGVFSDEVVPGTYGHPAAEFTASVIDGRWIISRHGKLPKQPEPTK